MPGVEFVNVERVREVLQKRAPQALQYATGFTINDTVVKGRREVIAVIGREMTVRTQSFVNKSTWFEKTKASLPIGLQVGHFGTRKIERSTGWIEQPIGGLDKRKRHWTKAARRAGRGVVGHKFRMKPGNPKIIASSIKGRRLSDLVAEVERLDHFNLPVVIGGNDYGIEPGVVKFMRRRKTVKSGRKMRFIKRLANAEDQNVRRVDIVGDVWRWVKRDVPFVWLTNVGRQIKRLRF